MRKLLDRLIRLVRGEQGATFVEYALLLLLVVFVVAAAAVLLGVDIRDLLGRAGTKIDTYVAP